MRILLVTAVLLAASRSHAEPPRYTRKPNLQIDPKVSDRVRPAQRRPTARRPEVSADALLLVEERRQPLRREQEALLEKLVRDTADSDPEKPELLVRLAEHYAQQLRFWRLQAVGATTPGRSR